MPTDDTVARREHFASHWLTWTALRHFLPVPLLRELFQLVVSKISNDTISLDQLFDEQHLPGIAGLDSWALRALPVTSPTATYLQHRIQNFLWQNDSDAYPPQNDEFGANRISGPIDLEAAVRLGVIDFMIDRRLLRNVRPGAEASLSVLAGLLDQEGAIVRTANLEIFVERISSQVNSVAMPLAAVMLKHAGDLCADVDEWAKAAAIYDLADRKLSSFHDPAWNDYLGTLRDILLQSIATATRVNKGSEAAFEQLSNALEHTTLSERPVLSMNAPFDALTAQILSSTSFHGGMERRATLLLAPLYHDAHNLDSAHNYLAEKKFNDAHRMCWSVLRRQIALGLAAETRGTKSVYSRAIFGQLENDELRGEAESFMLGVRLLVESGDSSGAEKFVWPEKLVEAYVNEQAVVELIAISDRYEGAAAERRKVAVEILRAWILLLSADRDVLAHRMQRYIAEYAEHGETAFSSSRNLGGRCLEILEELAKRRPEFRRGNVDEVLSAIVVQLASSDSWKGRSQALELAFQYMDVLSDDQSRMLVEGTLALLAKTDPAAQMWPLVRPALQLLVSDRSSQLAKREPELGKRMLATVLRFGIEQGTESASLIFYLRAFDPGLLAEASIIAAVRPVIEALRKEVATINSSATAGQVQALLLSPTISGFDGVNDALVALKAILKSSESNRPSIALPYSYSAVYMLPDRQDAFASELSIPRAEIDKKWHEIYLAVLNLWTVAKANPLIFAAFSLPSATKPNSAVVHNWAFASVRLAESIGQKEPMLAAMRIAAQQEALRDPVTLVLATGSKSDDDLEIDPSKILVESSEVFYAALGRRLAVLRKLDSEVAFSLCKALLTQCLHYGPRGLDAAVLVYASQLGLAGQYDEEAHSNYLKRLDENRDLRLSLFPLLACLTPET